MSRTKPRSIEAEEARYGWITTPVAGERIGVSAKHVVKLIRAGELRARNVALPGAKRPDFRVDPESVEEFLDRRTTEAA